MWFALGEVLAICVSGKIQVSVLIGTLAFCVLFFTKTPKKIRKMLWILLAFEVFGFLYARLYMYRILQLDEGHIEVVGRVIEVNCKHTESGVRYDAVVDVRGADVRDGHGGEVDECVVDARVGHGVAVDDAKDRKQVLRYKHSMARIILYDCGPDLDVGSIVKLSGDICYFKQSTNPGQMDMRRYYLSLGIHYAMYEYELEAYGRNKNVINNIGYNIKQRLSELRNDCSITLHKITDETTAAFYEGMLLGDRSAIDEHLKLGFQIVGIAHILAISGLHISLISALAGKLLRRLGIGIYASSVSVLVILFLYGMMTGFKVATVRAIAMMLLAVCGRLLGRDYDLLTADGVALLILIICNPYRIYDGGMWLSITAVTGVYIGQRLAKKLMPYVVCKLIKLKNRFIYGIGKLGAVAELRANSSGKMSKHEKRFIEGIVSSICVSLCISLVTLPISLMLYYQLSPYSVLVNILVLPFMMFVVFCGIAGLVVYALFSGISIFTGTSFMWLGSRILRFYVDLCNFVLRLPFCTVNTGKVSAVQIIFYYSAFGIIYLLFLSQRNTRKSICGISKRVASVFGRIYGMRAYVAAVVLIISASVIVLAAPYRDKEVIIFMDVGQGDAIAIKTKTGINICVDGGSSSLESVGRYVISSCLKYMGMSRIDYWAVSHMDTDHISGLCEILELGKLSGIRIENVVLSKYIVRDEEYDRLCELCEAAGTEIIYMDYRDKIAVGDFIEATGTGQTYFNYGNKKSYSESIIGRSVQEAGGFILECIHPSHEYWQDSNASSLALRYVSDSVEVWLLGDMDTEAIQDMLDNYGEKVSKTENRIIKIPHHGSKYSISEELYSRYDFDIAVISCGADNRYGHPHADLLDVLDKCGVRIQRTDKAGAIVLVP